MDSFPGRPPGWRVPLLELERVETDDPEVLLGFVDSLGLAGDPRAGAADVAVGILLGASACARLGGVPEPAPSPTGVPDCVAVAYRPGPPAAREARGARLGDWHCTWTDEQHAAAVEQVREAIARGDVYQANVVGHRSAQYEGDPFSLAAAVASIEGAPYGGMVTGEGWAVASASPEQLLSLHGDRVTTRPVKGTARDPESLRHSVKDHAEHVMIVDLERNDLARVTEAGSVVVEDLYALSEWAGLWHASSTVTGRLADGATVADVLRAVLPGGSVTGAPKHAACSLLAKLEPVGRGPAMGAFGFVWPGGLDLGLTIRTVAAANGTLHLWAGGGITWGSDPAAEVAEAHAKAGPVQHALAQVRPASS